MQNTPTIRDAAVSYAKVGLKVVPIVNKKPMLGAQWNTKASDNPQVVGAWYTTYYPSANVAILMHGQWECLDIDNPGTPSADETLRDLRDRLEIKAPGLFKRFVIERTPSGGYHLYYTCKRTGVSTVLAKRPLLDSEKAESVENQKEQFLRKQRDQVMDESITDRDMKRLQRGAEKQTQVTAEPPGGGTKCVTCYPSVGYHLVSGDICSIEEFSEDERSMVWRALRDLDQMPAQPASLKTSKRSSSPNETTRIEYAGGYEWKDVRDAYNAQHNDLGSVLERYGYEATQDSKRYRRSGGKSAAVAIYDGYVMQFSSSDGYLDPGVGYSAFNLFCLFEHGNDFMAAIDAARAELNMPKGKPVSVIVAPNDKRNAGDTPKAKRNAGDAPKAKRDAGDAPNDKRDAGDAPNDKRDAGDAPNDNRDIGDVATSLPIIDVTNAVLPETIAKIWHHVMNSQYASKLYVYGDSLAIHERGHLSILDTMNWVSIVSDCAARMKVDNRKASIHFWKTTDTEIKGSLLLRNIPESVPVVHRLVYTPVFSEDGQLLLHGCHPNEHVLVEYDHEIEDMSLDAAKGLLWELFQDFPFYQPEDYAHTIGYVLLPFIREMCGATPLHLITSSRRGTGKGLLNTIIHTIWGVSPLTYGFGSDEENRKGITTALIHGATSIIFDDVEKLEGHALQRVLTAATWSDRVLGYNKNFSIPMRCIFSATGNNVLLEGDMDRRTVIIRLDGTHEYPELRTDTKRSAAQLYKFARQERHRLIAACITIIKHGLKTEYKDPLPFGGFDEYAAVLGQILHNVGIDGFLMTHNSPQKMISESHAKLRELVQVWKSQCGGNPMSASELYRTACEHEMSDIIIAGESLRSREMAMSNLLRKVVGTVFSFDNTTLKLTMGLNKRGHRVYCIDDMTPQQPQEQDDNPASPGDDNPASPGDDNPASPGDDNPASPGDDDHESTEEDDHESTEDDDYESTEEDDHESTEDDDYYRVWEEECKNEYEKEYNNGYEYNTEQR